MKLVFLFVTLMTTNAFAKDFNLKCEATLNSDKLFSVIAKLPEGERNSLIAKTDEYDFFLSSNKNGVVELQVYNGAEPSRSYASALLTKTQFVELALWKRDSLLEARCTLID